MESSGMSSIKICVVGAGLAGSMMAALLGSLGMDVKVFEKREDTPSDTDNGTDSAFGLSTSAIKRSINLALSYRGMLGLREVGILDDIMKDAIAMPQRVIHTISGDVTTQAYGQPGEAIWSVGRQTINSKLLLVLKSMSNVQVFFNSTILDAQKDGKCTFRMSDGSISSFDFDLVVGADGAYSGVRECLLKQGRIDFSRNYIAHGYKELSIPPKTVIDSDGTQTLEYALDNHNGLHIWPRGKFMLIALPNPDKSFTATLFAPYKAEAADDHSYGFDSFDSHDSDQVTAFFRRNFPDVLPLMASIDKDFGENPVGSLVTVRVNPWNLGKVVLIGDAAHAVVPFYGQGMNAAFEDGFILYNLIKDALTSSSSDGLNLAAIAEAFATRRRLSANSLADMCLEHYDDMASNTASSFYLMKKKVELVIFRLFGQSFTPLYSMVAFSNVPYDEAVIKSARQDRIIGNILWGIAAAIGSSVAYGIYSKGRGLL